MLYSVKDKCEGGDGRGRKPGRVGHVRTYSSASLCTRGLATRPEPGYACALWLILMLPPCLFRLHISACQKFLCRLFFVCLSCYNKIVYHRLDGL